MGVFAGANPRGAKSSLRHPRNRGHPLHQIKVRTLKGFDLPLDALNVTRPPDALNPLNRQPGEGALGGAARAWAAGARRRRGMSSARSPLGNVARSAPRENTHNVPGFPCFHSSSRVSGSVATTATDHVRW